MAGGKKIALIKLTDSKKRGKAFVEELNNYLSPTAIASYKGNEKYPVLGRNKKPIDKYPKKNG